MLEFNEIQTLAVATRSNATTINTGPFSKRRRPWNKKLIKEFIKILGEADEIVAHNGDRFDIKEIRTRAIQTTNLMFPHYRTFGLPLRIGIERAATR